MCQSFTDLTLDRQEQIYVAALGYARAYPRDRYWEWRADGFYAHLTLTYEAMPADTLHKHLTELEKVHQDDPDWRPVIDMVAAALLKGRTYIGNAA